MQNCGVPEARILPHPSAGGETSSGASRHLPQRGRLFCCRKRQEFHLIRHFVTPSPQGEGFCIWGPAGRGAGEPRRVP